MSPWMVLKLLNDLMGRGQDRVCSDLERCEVMFGCRVAEIVIENGLLSPWSVMELHGKIPT